MGIFDRMGKVISSNVNALLDKAEDPKKSLELIVEEMKDQIRAARKELVDAVAAEKMLRKKVDDLDAESEKWEKRAELALKADDEKLAREALVQKKRVVGERDRAEAMRAEQRAAVLSMKSELERMEAKQEELNAKTNTLAAQIRQSKAGSGAEGLGAKPGGGAFAEFRRMEEQVEDQAAQASASRELDEALSGGGMSASELEAKFAQLEHGGGGKGEGKTGGSAVDDELAALKKKIRIGG
jgi:phage shock protein A